jgi:hypothetical protein
MRMTFSPSPRAVRAIQVAGLGLAAALTLSIAPAAGAQQPTMTTKTTKATTTDTTKVTHPRKHHRASTAAQRRAHRAAERGERGEARAESDQHISVRKDVDAHVVEPVVEAPVAVRVDTITRWRTDTVRLTTTEYRMHRDTVVVTRWRVTPKAHLPGLYAGLGAGLAEPLNSWRNVTGDGLALHGQLGYFPHESNLGLRTDGTYNMFSHRAGGCPGCADPRLLSGSGDLVLRLPVERRSRLNPVVYVLGGGGIDKFSNFVPYRNTDGNIVTAGGNTQLTTPGLGLSAGTAGDRSMFYHWDVGGGLAFNILGAHAFVETKYVSISTTGGHSRYLPIIGGLQLY